MNLVTMRATKIIVLILLLISTLASSVSAQTTIVGVSQGNTFNYNYSFSWQSTDPSATIPYPYTDLNNIQSMRISVRNVTGTTINLDFTKIYKNGGECTQNGNINIDTQLLELPYSVLIIRAGANSNENIYPSGGHAVLSGIETRSYSIGQVETIKYSLEETSDEGAVEKTNIYYDRENGVGMEYTFESTQISGGYVTTIEESLTIASWVIPEFSSLVFLALLFTAIPIIIIVYRKHFSKNDFRVQLKYP